MPGAGVGGVPFHFPPNQGCEVGIRERRFSPPPPPPSRLRWLRWR